MDDQAQARIKAFLTITDHDEQNVGDLKLAFERIRDGFVEDFYKHLERHPETARFLAEADLDRLKQMQTHFLERLLQGPYDETYFAERLAVGEAHHRIGLEPRWFLGAFNRYLQFCLPRFAAELGAEFPPPLASLLKFVLLDIGLVLETYFEARAADLERRNRELKEALRICFDAELRAQQLAKLAGHEIRSSLNAVGNACAEVAEDYADEVPSEARESLEQARDRCWRLMEVVEQILSEPERTEMRQWIDVQQVLPDVSQRLHLHSGDKDVSLTMFTASARVWACPVELREVFSILVANAVRHAEKPHVSVEIEHREEPGIHVFSVTDDGAGIPPAIQEKIFEPFFSRAGVKGAEGRGLGLYFARQIIERHGGRIWVESVPGSGSRFSFSLPSPSS